MRVLIPSVIVISLPMFELKASAAEKVIVPEGDGTWEMTISPEEPQGVGSLVLLAEAEEAVEDGFVPEPVESAEDAIGTDAEAGAENADAGSSNYWAIYRSIPFIRTEYLANPSYRHEATMELLTGQPRPIVVSPSGSVGCQAAEPDFLPPVISPYVYDRHLGYLSTFFFRYRPPAVPLNFYPLGYPLSIY